MLLEALYEALNYSEDSLLALSNTIPLLCSFAAPLVGAYSIYLDMREENRDRESRNLEQEVNTIQENNNQEGGN